MGFGRCVGRLKGAFRDEKDIDVLWVGSVVMSLPKMIHRCTAFVLARQVDRCVPDMAVMVTRCTVPEPRCAIAWAGVARWTPTGRSPQLVEGGPGHL